MSAGKTEQPTPQRLRQLRRQGEVPVSRELNRSFSLLGGVLAIVSVGPSMIQTWSRLALWCFGPERPDPIQALVVSMQVFAAFALPIAGLAAVLGITAGVVQTGLLFAPGRVLPDMKRFTPGQVWTSRFRMDALIQGTVALIAAIIGLGVAYLGMRTLLAETGAIVTTALERDVQSSLQIAARPLVVVGSAWLGIAAAMALIDLVWQRNSFMNRNKMSLQEIRDEYKRSEGDPQHKARRKRAHRELLQSSIKQGVGKADVVIRNPTHIAIGLRYRKAEIDAPVVTVAGRGVAAKSILREARRRGVPEFADKPTARVLVDIPVGDPVPEEMFEAVAVIFRWLGEQEALSRRTEAKP